MSTPIVATGAAALGFYVWLKGSCGYAGAVDPRGFAPPLPNETHAKTEQAPTTWAETIYLMREALRYMYQETFGRWHAVDLFFGLAFLSRRPSHEYPAADIAAAGQPLHAAQMRPQQLLSQLQEVKRYMLYCQGLKHHKPELQLKHWRITTGLEPEDVIKHCPTAGLLRPAFVIFKDRASHTIILCVRGTHSRSDMFTSLTGAVKPHHVVTPEGVALGYSHLGMLAAARWLLGQTKATLIQALQEHPDYQLRIVGHSMGGGTAAMLTMMMREKVPELSQATAWAIACPACMTLDLAASCAPFVTSLVHGTDIVPTFSSGAIDRLRDEVTQSSWFAEFQGEVRQRLASNFGASVRALRLYPTADWSLLNTAATSFKSCYSRGPRSCYSRGPSRAAMSAAAGITGDRDSPPVTPTSAAAAAAPQHRSAWGFSILSSRHAKQQQYGASAAESDDGAGTQLLAQDAAAAGAADEASALLPAARQHAAHAAGPLQWLRTVGGGRGRRPGFAAAASSRGSSDAGSGGGLLLRNGQAPDDPAAAEAALVEQALQACLLAADAGQLAAPNGEAAAAAAAAGAGGGRAPALPPSPPAAAAAYASGGATAAGRGAALASSWAAAASRMVLRTKPPAAPGKKDDDTNPASLSGSVQPPLQQSRAEAADGGGGGAAAGAGGRAQLPVSTAATSGSVHAASAAATAAAAAAAAGAGGADAGGGGSSMDGSSDRAAAASSASKPRPSSLRSRRGWAWGSVLGSSGPGDQGWVGQTVGSTSRLMVETTGQLLKSSNVLFQACTAPVNHPVAAAAAAAAAATAQAGAAADDARGSGGSSGGGARSGIVVAPSTSSGMERGADAGAPFGAALLAAGRQRQRRRQQQQRDNGVTHGSNGCDDDDDDEGSTSTDADSDSDSDPDLQEGTMGGGHASTADPFSLLDQPGLRGNISALVAAVSADASAAGTGRQGVSERAHNSEERAAERLLQELGPSASDGNIQRLAQQQQHPQQGPQHAAVSGANSSSSDGGGGGAGAPAAAAAAAGTGSADGSTASSSGRDKAAERLARRRMYPAGRVLHLMPRSACLPTPAADDELLSPSAPAEAAAAAAADDTDSAPGGGARVPFPALSAAQGSVGLGDEYVLLEVADVQVYGRVKLCPSMVRDHFIPSYLAALDSVLKQLKEVAAAEQPAEGGVAE